MNGPQRGHLIAKEQKSRDGTLLARYAYAVNTLGQREQVSATGTAHPQPLEWNWRYNERGEVVNAKLGQSEWSYAYDTIGNRREASAPVGGASVRQWKYQSNALNQYTEIRRKKGQGSCPISHLRTAISGEACL